MLLASPADEIGAAYGDDVARVTQTSYKTSSSTPIEMDLQLFARGKGRSGKQARLRQIAKDDKISSALRGDIKRDINEIKIGKRKNIRVPKGYEMAHRRGFEARYGYGYEHSDLQVIKNHRTQHKIDGYGRK